MTISSIMYDWGTSPTIIRMTTTSTLAQITTTGFWVLPATIAAIESINNGEFDVPEGSVWLINFADGEGFFTLNTSTNAFVAETDPGQLSNTLQSARIFVGNASNIATGVAMSGDTSITNAGVVTIEDDAVTTAKILDEAVTTAKIDDDAVTVGKLAPALKPSHVVKFAGQHTTTNDTTNTITVTGALDTDLAFVQMVDDGTNSVTIVDAVMTADTLSVTFSGAPATDTVINYQVLRAIA